MLYIPKVDEYLEILTDNKVNGVVTIVRFAGFASKRVIF